MRQLIRSCLINILVEMKAILQGLKLKTNRTFMSEPFEAQDNPVLTPKEAFMRSLLEIIGGLNEEFVSQHFFCVAALGAVFRSDFRRRASSRASGKTFENIHLCRHGRCRGHGYSGSTATHLDSNTSASVNFMTQEALAAGPRG